MNKIYNSKDKEWIINDAILVIIIIIQSIIPKIVKGEEIIIFNFFDKRK